MRFENGDEFRKIDAGGGNAATRRLLGASTSVAKQIRNREVRAGALRGAQRVAASQPGLGRMPAKEAVVFGAALKLPSRGGTFAGLGQGQGRGAP